MTEKKFAITFPEGPCGLELAFNEKNKTFLVTECSTDFAKMYRPILVNAEIVSLNWKPTSEQKNMEEMYQFLKSYEQREKRLIFLAHLMEKQVHKLISLSKNEFLEILDYDEKKNFKPGHYFIDLECRPLGFIIASSPTGVVEVVQVDPIHEEILQIGSKLVAVNGRYVNEENDAIQTLLRCFIPVRLVFDKTHSKKLCVLEEKGEIPAWLDFSDLDGDIIWLSIHWFDQMIGKKDFVLPIKTSATVREIRAKVAVTSQLKFNAVNLIWKMGLLKDDDCKLSHLNFKDGQKLSVVVSLSGQKRSEVKVLVDFQVEMKIMGAFLKTCDKSLLRYLWDDIDVTGKGFVHITELHRFAERFLGLYERANCLHIPKDFKDGFVTFNTKESLGLIIEGNEIIMTGSKSQANRLGIEPGWRVVGAEYTDREGHKVKITMNPRSCLKTLKRARAECADDCFRIHCHVPRGRRWEMINIMKKQAISDFNLNDRSLKTYITRKQYDLLPQVYAIKAIRVNCGGAVEASSLCARDNAGMQISEGNTNPRLKNFIGGHVLSINSTTVAHLSSGDVLMILFMQKPPHILTIDPASS